MGKIKLHKIFLALRRIDVFPVPTTAYFKEGDKKVPSTIASEFLQNHILGLAETIPEDIKIPVEGQIIGQ